MGKQVRFRAAAEDEAAMAAIIASSAEVVLLRGGNSLTGELSVTDCLADATYVARRADLAYVKPRPVGDVWVLNALSNPVVEYSRGYDADGRPFPRKDVRHGRLYFDTGPWVGREDLTAPPEAFLQWADKVLASVRRRWVRVDTAYEGPIAHALLNEE